MKVYIMTDMEGVAGVLNHDDWVTPSGPYYENGKELLTLEINSAAEGFFDAGADEILAADGHGYGGINTELLDNRIFLQRKFTGPYPFGLDKTFDVIAWVGQHPKAGTQYGHICHTGWFDVIDYRINDISVGEFGQLAFCAGELGVTPIFASGCKAFAEEAASLVKGIHTAVVKYGLTPDSGIECNCDQYRAKNLSAIHLPPERARKVIKTNAYNALKAYLDSPESFVPVKIKAPYTIDVDLRDNGDIKAHSYHKSHANSIIECLNS